MSFAVAIVSDRQNQTPHNMIIVPNQMGLTHSMGYQVVDLYDKAAGFNTILPDQNLTIQVNSSS